MANQKRFIHRFSRSCTLYDILSLLTKKLIKTKVFYQLEGTLEKIDYPVYGLVFWIHTCSFSEQKWPLNRALVSLSLLFKVNFVLIFGIRYFVKIDLDQRTSKDKAFMSSKEYRNKCIHSRFPNEP